ncbi:hypothetical protein Tco_0846845 [Tanacetum coccineum]
MLSDNDNSKVNFHTMEADVPNEADFDVRILIASVKELDDTGYTRDTIHIEYEWKPPRCGTCAVFGHLLVTCTKVTKEAPRNYVDTSNDGFQVAKKRGHNRQHEKIMGLKMKSKLFIDMCLLMVVSLLRGSLEEVARVGPLSGRDPLVIVVADTNCLPHVDSFACPASFPWHADKNVSIDPFSKSTEFSADDYVVLVAHSAPFWKFSEPFLCLIGMSRNYTLDEDTYPTFLHDDMDLFAFIQVVNPTKVKVGEKERTEGELEASVDMLFNEGGITDQGDSAVGGGQEAETELATGVRIIVDENVVAERPKYPRKKRQAVTDASDSSHPPKKLRGDHETSSGAATGGKSPSALRVLLASSILNVEAGFEDVATLPLVTSSVSVMPEHESGAPADSITGLNLRTIGPSKRFVCGSSSNDDHAVITSNVASIPSDQALEVDTKVISPVHASMFHDSESTRTVRPNAAGSSHIPGKELLMGSWDINSETLHKVFVPQWNVSNDTLLDDHDVSQEFINHLAPPVLFAQIHKIDYHHLFTKFNVGTARQACLNAKFRMRTEYYLSEKRKLESECEKQANLLKARDADIESLKAQLLLKKTEAAEAARAQVSATEATKEIHVDEVDALKQKNVALKDEKDSLDGKIKDGLVDQTEEFQDAEMNIVNDMVAKLDADLLEMALHLEEKFYPHLLTTISGRRWLLTHGLKLVVVKCLNYEEYLSALGASISRAIENGMHDGLSPDIDHGKAGRSLADVVAYNPVVEADYNSAIQRLREVDFSLLSELKSHKDASVEDIINLLRLEGPLADAPEMSDLQPHVDQFMLPVHQSEDQVVLGETSLSFALSVTHS